MGETQGVQQPRRNTPADTCEGVCLTNTYREPCKGSGGAAQPWPQGERSHCREKHLAKQHGDLRDHWNSSLYILFFQAGFY